MNVLRDTIIRNSRSYVELYVLELAVHNLNELTIVARELKSRYAGIQAPIDITLSSYLASFTFKDIVEIRIMRELEGGKIYRVICKNLSDTDLLKLKACGAEFMDGDKEVSISEFMLKRFNYIY